MAATNVKKISKFEFNKYIVGQRGGVKQGINHAINRLTREADRYRRKKTVNDQQKEKNVRRADRYIEELQYIKSLHPDDVTKFAVLCKKTYKDVGSNPNSSIEERALTRLAEHKHIQPAIKKFQDDYPNWSAEVPDIIKSLGVNYRKKRLKTLAAKGKLDPVMEKERKLFLILHEAAGLDVDPKLLQPTKSVISLNKKKKETPKDSKSIKKKIDKFISEEEDTAYESEDVYCDATNSSKDVALENSESDDDYYDAIDAKVNDDSDDSDGGAIEAEENDDSDDSDSGAVEAEKNDDSENSDCGAIEAEENDDSEDADCGAIEAEENDDSEDSDNGAIEAEENDDSEDSDGGAIEAEENDDSEDADGSAIEAEENVDSEDSDGGAIVAEENGDSEDSDGGAIEAEENDDSEDADGGAIEAEENDDSEDSDGCAIEAEENDDSEDSDGGAIEAEEKDDSEDADCVETIHIKDDEDVNSSKVMEEQKKRVKKMKLSNKNINHKIKCDESISIIKSDRTKNVVAKSENDVKSQIKRKELSPSSLRSKKLNNDKKISKNLKLKLLQSLESKDSENIQNSSPVSNQRRKGSLGIIDSIFSNFDESKLQKNKKNNFLNSKSTSFSKKMPIKSVIKGTCQVKQIDLRNKADLMKDPMNAILSKRDNSDVSDDENNCNNPDSLNLKKKKSSFFLGYQGNDVEDSDKESYINDDFNGVNSIKGKINSHENRSSFFRTSLSHENNAKTNDNSAASQNQYNDGLNRFERRRQKFGALEHHREKIPFYNNKGSSTEDFGSGEPPHKLQKSEYGSGYHDKKVDRTFRNKGGRGKFNKNRMSSFQNSGSNSMPLGDRHTTHENKAPQESLLHPSWAAKKKEAQLSSAINAFQGKRVTFDD